MKVKRCIMVSYFADKRYTEKSEVVTHDLIKYDSIECKNLTDKLDIMKTYEGNNEISTRFYRISEKVEEIRVDKDR